MADHAQPGPVRHWVGVELEFVGLSARAAATALASAFGGSLQEEDRHAYELSGSALGDIAVELDIRHAHPQRHGAALSFKPSRRLAGVFGTIVSPFVPQEMIMPPRPDARLSDVDQAIDVLRRSGARGDGRVWRQTLGLHLNIETRMHDVASIRAMTLAYAGLDGRMRARVAEGDGKLAGLLPPSFPDAYVRCLQDSAPRNDPAEFIDDYLEFNPTRQRALDLLPLLLHLDGPRVRRRLPYEKIAARPVYHWRLPVSRVGRPGWGIASDWSAWLEVESVAAEISRAA